MRFGDYNGIIFFEIRLAELKIWILQNYTEAATHLMVYEKLFEQVARIEKLPTQKL
jgi:hypothetical protein